METCAVIGNQVCEAGEHENSFQHEEREVHARVYESVFIGFLRRRRIDWIVAGRPRKR